MTSSTVNPAAAGVHAANMRAATRMLRDGARTERSAEERRLSLLHANALATMALYQLIDERLSTSRSRLGDLDEF